MPAVDHNGASVPDLACIGSANAIRNAKHDWNWRYRRVLVVNVNRHDDLYDVSGARFASRWKTCDSVHLDCYRL
jgi:hypothetical protein